MHAFDAKNGTTFNFNPDMSGKVRVFLTPTRDEVWVDGADLIEFMRHVDSLKRKGNIVYNGDNEFEIAGHRSTMSAGLGTVTGDASCKLLRGDTFDPSLPTTIGEMPIMITRPTTAYGPVPNDMLVGFEYVSEGAP
jgi:hypothetical protein